MNERRLEEAIEQRLEVVEERLSAIEVAMCRAVTRLDNLDELVRGLLGNRFDVRVLALEVGMKRLSDWQAEADERLDWRRRPSAE